MRKGYAVIGFATVLLAAVACSGTAPTPTPAAQPTPTAPPVVSPTAAPTVVATPAPTPTAAAVDPVALGKSLSARNGCTACHSIDGSATIGPTWKGLYGKVDEAYLRESIVDPDAKIAKGFSAGIMPKGFGAKLSEHEIGAIIAYIETLK